MMMYKLFTVGFPREMDELGLDELFSMHGMVRKITIVRDLQTGVRKGYGFVEMLDAGGADRAVKALDGYIIGTRQLSVRTADKQQGRAASHGSKVWGDNENSGQQSNTRNNGRVKRPRRYRS